MTDDATDLSPPHAAPDRRVVSIDILRGLAILWVMVFHLYVDMTFHLGGASDLYPAFRDRLGEGRPLPALTALGELVLGQGYMGVAVFMLLSGLSLTMNASRRGEPRFIDGYRTRFRRLLVPYWGGVLFLVGVVALVAFLQMLLDGGTYHDQWFNVRIAVLTPVNVYWQDVLWALSVFLWLFRERLATVPVGSLWFVELLLQYYLLFPLALMLLRRFGPWRFAALGLVVTLASRALFVGVAGYWMGTARMGHFLESIALFRGSEFVIGMSIGWLLVNERETIAEWVQAPLDIFGLVVIAVLLIMGGTVLTPKADALLVVGDVMVQVGLAVIMLPLLFKAPGRLEVSVLAKGLTFLGVISFTALIVDDGMRYIASFLRYEGVTGVAWWTFLVVVYVPVGTLIAYPMAALFGLLPKQRAAQAPQPAARAPAPEGVTPAAEATGAT